MERKIVGKLRLWKDSPNRLPLILQGARQVGKTYILLSFGKAHYKNVAYFSMEESREISKISECHLRFHFRIIGLFRYLISGSLGVC